MIYYSNTTLHVPHMTFIGRWNPFHKGHEAIIRKKMEENPKVPILLLIRNTINDVYSPTVRGEYIKSWMKKNYIAGTIMIIPNVEGVYWGRDVGYKTQLVDVDMVTKKISGSGIRDDIQKNKSRWRSLVAHKNDSYLLSKNVSTIIEHGLVVWLTGCPSSGKTTIANTLIDKLKHMYPYLKIQLLDGDHMRTSPLAKHVGFTPKDRADHILRMAYLAKMFADHGILTICAFVSPDRAIRKKAKIIIGKRRFIEVYIKASRATRIKRDTKGMYKQAIAGKLRQFTGYSAPYQPPLQPDVRIDTDEDTVKQSVNTLITHIFSIRSL